MTDYDEMRGEVGGCRQQGGLAGQGRVRGEGQRTFLNWVTATTGRPCEVGVLRHRRGLTHCMVVVVGAGKHYAARLHDSDNPEEKPTGQQNTRCLRALGEPARSRRRLVLVSRCNAVFHALNDKPGGVSGI